MDDLGQYLLIGFAVLCLLPLVIFGVLAIIVYRAGEKRVDSWLGPDVAQLEQQYADLRARHPNARIEDLLPHIIHGQAVKCGIIGAVTGIGGLITLPIALPIDIVLSFRIQAALINFIAQAYGSTVAPEGRGASVRSYLIMTGSSRVTQTTTGFFTRMALRIIGKSFSKLIPVVGALIGFAVNYAIVQVMGRAAVRWYASQQGKGDRARQSA
jgi:hypothetical protein